MQKSKKPKETAAQYALRLLARREYAVAQMRHKLFLRGYSADDIESTLADYQDKGWLSDARFADCYVRMRQRAGMGPLKIQYECTQKGVDEKLIHQCASWHDYDWSALAHRVLVKKYGRVPIEGPSDYQKRKRFLLQRGFTAECAAQTLKAGATKEV